MPSRQVYFLHEVAGMLGLSVDRLRRPRRLERLYAAGMPRSLTSGPGEPLRFPKAAFDAWIEGRPPAAAPAELERDWKSYLAEQYPVGSD